MLPASPLPLANLSGNPDAFPFKTSITLARATITSHLCYVRLLLVLTPIFGSPTPTIYPQLSSQSDAVKISWIVSLLCSEFSNGSPVSPTVTAYRDTPCAPLTSVTSTPTIPSLTLLQHIDFLVVSQTHEAQFRFRTLHQFYLKYSSPRFLHG